MIGSTHIHYSIRSLTPRRFEGAVDFDRIFTGAGRVPGISVRGHLGPSLSKSLPPHEPSPAIVCVLPQLSLMLWVHGLPSLAIPSLSLKSDVIPGRC